MTPNKTVLNNLGVCDCPMSVNVMIKIEKTEINDSFVEGDLETQVSKRSGSCVSNTFRSALTKETTLKHLEEKSKMNDSENSAPECLFLEVVDITHDGFILSTEVSLSVVNSLFSITAMITNAFIAFDICKTPSLQTPSNVLLWCLASSDFTTGFLAQPSFVGYKIAELTGDSKSACVGRVMHWVAGFTCTGVSVLTFASIAIDKYLALHLHLKYKQIVSNHRISKLVFLIWASCTSVSFSVVFANSDKYWTFLPLAVQLLSLFVTAICYLQIFRILRRHQSEIMATEQTLSQSRTTTIDLKKYERSAMTMFYVVILFICTNIPFLIAMAVRVVGGSYDSSLKLAYECGCTFAYINSTLNPVLYLARMKDVRRAALVVAKSFYFYPSDRVIQLKIKADKFDQLQMGKS